VGDGACYKRRNDDCGSSFRNRDNSGQITAAEAVKSLFNRLKLRQELARK